MRAQAKELWVGADAVAPADVAGLGAIRRDLTVSKGEVTAVVTTPAIMLDLGEASYQFKESHRGKETIER